MHEWLEILLKISIAVFMIGNLLGMGLVLRFEEAVAALQNPRFVILSVLLGFVVGPGIAWLLVALIPMQQPFAIGLILVGMTPCAPFLPAMVKRARGDVGYTAVFMLLASVITVIYMPIFVPVLAEGLTADAWTIAKPLIYLVLVPLAIGLWLQRTFGSAATKFHPLLMKVTGIVTVIMLVLCVIVYGEGFIDAVGTYAIGVQALFYILVTAASLGLGIGLPREQKGVLVLGICTRNLGAAFAPLFAVAAVDERAIIMVALGVPLQTVCAILVAVWLGRAADRQDAGASV